MYLFVIYHHQCTNLKHMIEDSDKDDKLNLKMKKRFYYYNQ